MRYLFPNLCLKTEKLLHSLLPGAYSAKSFTFKNNNSKFPKLVDPELKSTLQGMRGNKKDYISCGLFLNKLAFLGS